MMSDKVLVVVDMQNDFIDGSLKNEEAIKIVPNVVEFIDNWNDQIFVTLDTHDENYLNTPEGKKLPVKHCIKGTDGWKLNKDVETALNRKKQRIFKFEKPTFGSIELMKKIGVVPTDEIVLIGLCSDICVLTNSILAKTYFPDAKIVVKADCCAGVTPETHNAALTTMRMCQIDVE